MAPPTIRVGGAKPKPKKPNAVRRIMEREESRERRVRESSATVSSTAQPSNLVAPSRRLNCSNKGCKNPNVENGTCLSCGAVVEENNIVAEITFGEQSNGAAMVQGSYLAADQGAVRSSGGLAFRRTAGGGSEARERSLKEAKTLLQQFCHQLRVSLQLVDAALRLYKMASNSNFVQGRKKPNVTAICLYAVCRKETNNKVMLIDFADLIKTDVFLLGRGYKDLLSRFPDMKEGTKPIIMEDLIFRFATKLEFYHDTNKVAESAVRIAARMRKDNMTHGRRPAGICGAALIMAARAHNYRRTVREVVYIAKVTMDTLQQRMEEFANVPSAQMTIREFHEQDFLETSHDPPWVYKQTKEWKEKHGGHTRKRKSYKANDQPGEGREQGSGDKRQRTATSAPEQASEESASLNQAAGIPTPGPSASQMQSPAPPIIDKDGFVVPPLPQRASEPAPESTTQPTPEPTPEAHERSVITTATVEIDDQLEALADEFGAHESDDSGSENDEIDPSSEMAMAAAQGIEVPASLRKGKAAGKGAKARAAAKKATAKKTQLQMPIDEAWELDEANLEKEMEEHLNDPELIGASAAVTKDIEQHHPDDAAADNANTSSAEADIPIDPSIISTPVASGLDDPIIHEDEFKDDPEVMFCKLGDAEVKIKEMIWANHNKDYMRQVQQKIFESKMLENGPPKQRRNRTKKPRIGEGQASPAGSAEEAAMNMMRTRGISTKLDYSRLPQVFDMSRGPGSTYGGTSSVGSRSALGSVLGSEAGSDDEDESTPPPNGLQSPSPASGTATTAPSTVQANPAAVNKAAAPASVAPSGDEEVDDSSMYNGYEEDTYVEEDFDPFA